MSLDVRMMEVLVSRICHDLISPVSAVSNGAELVADVGPGGAVDDAFDLIRTSAQSASIRLQAFRLAYGAGGSEWHVSMDDVEKSFGDYIGLEHRYKLQWDVKNAALPNPLPRGLPKLGMMLLMWAMECLPKGGTVSIHAERDSDERVSLVVAAEGENAALREGAVDAYEGNTPSDMLSPKIIHPAITGQYVRNYQMQLMIGATASHGVQFKISARL